MSPMRKPAVQMPAETFQRAQCGKLSHTTVIRQPASAVAEPTPRVNSIRKNSTANSCRQGEGRARCQREWTTQNSTATVAAGRTSKTGLPDV